MKIWELIAAPGALQEPEDWLPVPKGLWQGHQVQRAVPRQGASTGCHLPPPSALWHARRQTGLGTCYLRCVPRQHFCIRCYDPANLGHGCNCTQILKSHPVSIRSEANKKRRQVGGPWPLPVCKLEKEPKSEFTLNIQYDYTSLLRTTLINNKGHDILCSSFK